MRLPPFLLLCAIGLWGWQGDILWPALLLGVGLESLRLLRWHWPQDESHLQIWLARLFWLTLGLYALLIWYLFAFPIRSGPSQVPLLQWLVIPLLPFSIALQTSGQTQIDLGFVKLALGQIQPMPIRRKANLGYAWLTLWLLAASAANPQGHFFYFMLCACSAWALWQIRPPQAIWRWCLALCLSAALGGGISLGLYRMQSMVEEWAMEWLAQRPPQDPISNQTALGHIGQLKLSERIQLQVVSHRHELTQPLLLMQASYNVYHATQWKLTGNNSFVDLPQYIQPPKRVWELASATHAPQPELEITALGTQDRSLLALPLGTHSIYIQADAKPGLHALSRNPLGSVQASTPIGHFRYWLQFNSENPRETLPGLKELQLPQQERASLQKLAQDLQLHGKNHAQVVQIVRGFFATGFRYSTWRDGQRSDKTALQDFLLHSRSGHCEHFATATALLLRAAGVPTRYATGYSVQEENPFGRGYLVRQRHAHAWVRVFLDGRWQDLDTTPPDWSALEAPPSNNLWQDALFWLRMQWLEWEWQHWQFFLLIASLALYMLRRHWRSGKPRTPTSSSRHLQVPTPALPSELQAILQQLADHGLACLPQETLYDWLRRIEPGLQEEASRQLFAIVQCYYQARYGPPVQTPPGWQHACQAWLQRWPKDRAKQINFKSE